MPAAGENCRFKKGLSPAEFCPLIKVTEKITNYSLHCTFDNYVGNKIEYLFLNLG